MLKMISTGPTANKSSLLFQQAKKWIPGGVNSPVRSFYAVEGEPIFMRQGKGAFLISEDDQSYIDYIGSWGPMILGHAYPSVIEKVKAAVDNGLGFGTTTKIEIQLAEKIGSMMPNIELIRMVNSGTEATMSAIRLARGFTRRNKIIKFEGCYHGHSDSLLVKAGSGALTLGVPSSPGVPADLVQHTLTATFNDLASVEEIFSHYPDDIACIIVEPVAGNMNLIPAELSFLHGLRKLCDQHHSMLIFDEVMTGFRITAGGAQDYYHIKPDLTCLGKIIGGGQPVGAFGGNREIMEYIAPLGPVYQAGTLSGNPIAMTAGLATLEAITAIDHFYDILNQQTKKLVEGLQAAADKHHIPLVTQHVHSMFGLYFSQEDAITRYQQVIQCDMSLFKKFYHGMLKQGVYLAPSAFEAGFVSIAHDDAVIDQTIAVAEKVFATL